MRYLVQPRDQIFVKGHGFLCFAKNRGKTLNGKYSSGMLAMHQKLLDHAKQSATDAFKADSNSVIQKTVEATGDLIFDKIAKRITEVSKIHNKIT